MISFNERDQVPHPYKTTSYSYVYSTRDPHISRCHKRPRTHNVTWRAPNIQLTVHHHRSECRWSL